MKRSRRAMHILSPMLLATAVSAQTYEIAWHTIDCGGGVCAGGPFSLTGTIGQPDAHEPMAGGVYEIRGGFWVGEPGACPGDWDGNGVVNSADVGAYLSVYYLDLLNGTTNADYDGNGVTNAADVGAFLTDWFPAQGACP